MAGLICPQCDKPFDIADWRVSATCPHCGERVRFEVAAALTQYRAATADDVPGQMGGERSRSGPVSTPSLAELSALPPKAREPLSVLGKPLVWTAGWTVVLLVWLLAAGGLLAVRLDMGDLGVLSSREQRAISAVEQAELKTDISYRQALALVVDQFAGAGYQPRWYAQDRRWERRVYVTWELAPGLRLDWAVDDDGSVRASADTELFLKKLVQAAGPPQVSQ